MGYRVGYVVVIVLIIMTLLLESSARQLALTSSEILYSVDSVQARAVL